MPDCGVAFIEAAGLTRHQTKTFASTLKQIKQELCRINVDILRRLNLGAVGGPQSAITICDNRWISSSGLFERVA